MGALLSFYFQCRSHEPYTNPYLECQGDLVHRLIIGIIGVTIWVIVGVINLLTKSP